MPDIAIYPLKKELEDHRTAIPIDHPDRSITRSKLEYPTENVSFTYLSIIDKVVVGILTWSVATLTRDVFTDKAVFGACQVYRFPNLFARYNDINNMYLNLLDPDSPTEDHRLDKIVNGSQSDLAVESVDIDSSKGECLVISCIGSIIKSLRYEQNSVVDPLSLPTPTATLTATDTDLASGYFGFRLLRETYPHGSVEELTAYLLPPMSPGPPAQYIVECEVEGSGKQGDPYRPKLRQELVDVNKLSGLPEFLYREAKRYEILRATGFTDEEIEALFGRVPKHQVDLCAVTYGTFEFKPQHSTAIVVIYGDNPYRSGAISKQIEHVKSRGLRTFRPPRDYQEAVTLYRELRKDYQHWLAGKDNFAYQVLGHSCLELFTTADFYYGELVEHRTHYSQLKRVPDSELHRLIDRYIDALRKVDVLHSERDKHIDKLLKVKKLGW